MFGSGQKVIVSGSEGERMAKTSNRTATARRNVGSARNTRGMYVEGSAVRKLQEMPERRYVPPRQTPVRKQAEPIREQTAYKNRQLSREAQKNRAKATSMSKGFVCFIAVMSVCVLFCCIHYLQLKSEITGSMKTVARLESELAQLKEDNDAYYSQVNSAVDLAKIRKIAIGRLGMKYPTEEQIMTYETEGNSYVRQYQDIPDSK